MQEIVATIDSYIWSSTNDAMESTYRHGFSCPNNRNHLCPFVIRVRDSQHWQAVTANSAHHIFVLSDPFSLGNPHKDN